MKDRGEGDRYRPGDHLVIDDRTGFVEYASGTKREWNGLRVATDVFERRHPQDFVRGRRDDQRVSDPRVPPVPAFVGPLTTEVAADAPAGSFSITVESSARFRPADAIRVMLANSDCFRVTVVSVPDAVTITLLKALPAGVTVGAAVINETAVATVDIG